MTHKSEGIKVYTLKSLSPIPPPATLEPLTKGCKFFQRNFKHIQENIYIYMYMHKYSCSRNFFLKIISDLNHVCMLIRMIHQWERNWWTRREWGNSFNNICSGKLTYRISSIQQILSTHCILVPRVGIYQWKSQFLPSRNS